MVEAMMALTLVDHVMMQKAQCELFPPSDAEADQPNPMGKTAHRPGFVRQQPHAAATKSNSPVISRVDEE